MADQAPMDRSDGVREKLRLLESAYASGRHDVAASLAASIRETALFEHQRSAPSGTPDLAAADFARVDELPAAWAAWAQGWSFYKGFSLFETVGLERVAEPCELRVAFRTDQLTDPFREIRVIRVGDGRGEPRQVPCQVLDVVRDSDTFDCRLSFFAEIAVHGQATYMVLYGNPLAELPDHPTDLRTRGDGYGLDVENHYFTARLSRQMGQLERLVSKRQHGLELYAGGKGHGEPPCIDWAHDYVDADHFQKLRMRNWPRCPNYEVSKGPLCVTVRRWGFPHSPVHPLFTPSRVHMDQTYVFYAGQPYFIKEGRIEVIKPVKVEAMRDDEWVFSGYSFTDTLWMDGQGKLHTGPVTAGHTDDLWAVGFYHGESRDCFLALRLQHAATKGRDIQHGGVPTLHYDGHGQLWSRYPVERSTLPKGASITQKNAYFLMAYPERDAATYFETVRHRLMHPPEVQPAVPVRAKVAPPRSPLARHGETPETAPLKPAVWGKLRLVRDEQLYSVDANIVDMGYVYDVSVRDGIARVLVTMPHRGRPEYAFLESQGGGRVEKGIRERLLEVDGVREVVVECTWSPAWTAARMSEAARKDMGV